MTNVEVNTVEIAQKLYEKLKGTGWDEALRTYLLGDSFQTLLNELVKLRNEGKRITPPLKNVFRAFQECPANTVKVVMIGQDPYPQFNVADGIAFSCGNTKYPEASLRYMLKEISLTVPEDQRDPVQSADLKRWSNQGLLMINCALTTNVGEIGKHYDLWSDFIAYDYFIYYTNHKIHVSHPASAAYNKESRWNSNNLFNQVNDYLTSVNQTSIIW